MAVAGASCGEIQWCFSQVKGTADEEVTEADIISTVEFNETGNLLATGDKGGRVVIFQRDLSARTTADYYVYSTFQSHEAEFDYLKSLEIEEKINKIRWLKQCNQANFLLATNDKTIKLWKIVERTKRAIGFNTVTDSGLLRDARSINRLRVPYFQPTELTVEALPRRIFANAHAYHINSVSVNSDHETFLSADDLRINLWSIDNNMESFNVLDIKPANMEELTEVITSAEFHPRECNQFVYSISKGAIRLCDMRASALCDHHSKVFEEPEDPASKSFFSEIIASISDVRFSHSGRYLLSRDYLTVKVWDVNMESRPLHTYQVHDHLRSQLCPLYENDCIFDKFECGWSGDDSHIITGSYNNFFRVFDIKTQYDVCLEASRECARPLQALRPKKVVTNSTVKRKKDELGLENIDFNRKVLHSSWHPKENILAVAATNSLFLFHGQQSR